MELCEECGIPAKMTVTAPKSLVADNGHAYYNYGLGKVVRSKQDVRAELSRIKGETGREVYEIGNEVIKKSKPKKKDWLNDQAIADFKKIRGR